jgi:hypothetical protein
LLIPALGQIAFATSFIWVALPMLIQDEQLISYAFIGFALVSIGAYFLIGLLLDCALFKGSLRLAWLWTGIALGMAVLFALTLADWIQEMPWLGPCMIALLALLNSAANNIVTVIQTRDLDPRYASAGFALAHCVYCIFYAMISASLGLWSHWLPACAAILCSAVSSLAMHALARQRPCTTEIT